MLQFFIRATVSRFGIFFFCEYTNTVIHRRTANSWEVVDATDNCDVSTIVILLSNGVK